MTGAAVEQWPTLPRSVWRALRAYVEPYAGVTFTIPGDPAPKERPRLGAGGGTRTPEKTVAAEKRVWQAFRDALPDWQPEHDRTYGIMVEFRTRSVSKVDIDNGMKLTMDALNTTAKRAGFWGDDIQVGQMLVDLVRYGEPGVQVWLFAVEPNGTPMSKMCECGTRYRSQDSMCRTCRTQKTIVNQLLGDDADQAAEQLARDRRAVFSYITASMIGSNVAPTIAAIAAHAGITQTRAGAVVETLIQSKHLARTGRRLKVVKPLGAAA